MFELLIRRRTGVKKVIVHSDYDADTFDHDLALLELEEKIEYTKTVGPICLPDRNKEEDFKNIYATQRYVRDSLACSQL